MNQFRYGWAEELGRALAGRPNPDDINPKTGKAWRTTAEKRQRMSEAQRLSWLARKAEALRAARAARKESDHE